MIHNLSPVMVINNTGIILSKLDSVNGCSFFELMDKTGLDVMDFYIAIGYLLKEESIILVQIDKKIQIRLNRK